MRSGVRQIGWAAAVAAVLAGRVLAGSTITIVHTNDVHGDLMATCRAATAVERLRRDTPALLLLDAGDLSDENRSMEYVALGRAVMPLLMNRMRYDAVTPGNHDMEGAVIAPRLAGLACPVLYANPTVEALQQARVKSVPFIVKEIGGVRVGLFGLTTNGATAAERAKQILPQLRTQADVIVALTHLGIGADEALARDVPGIDLIIGGHTHVRITPPKRVGRTAIVCAGAHGEELGVTELRLDDAKRVTGVSGALVSLWTAEAAPAPALWKTVADLRAEVGGEKRPMGDEVGVATAAFLGSKYDREAPLGNLVADALRAHFKADVALLRANVLPPQLAEGPITVADLYHVVRWDAPAFTITLKGNLLRQVLERMLDDEVYYLRTSGVRVWCDLRQPLGKRLVRVEVNGAPLDDARMYRIATEEWLAMGRGGFPYFTQGAGQTRADTDVRSILFASLRKAKRVSPPALGRLVDVREVKQAA
jgi:5'-nucleotidase/UDP-sugar diphosphatase